eukprot:2529788-Karenia_brevis.AAC.1
MAFADITYVINKGPESGCMCAPISPGNCLWHFSIMCFLAYSMEEYFGKGRTLCASCSDAIGWCGNPRVKLVASDAPTCHVHLEAKFQH